MSNIAYEDGGPPPPGRHWAEWGLASLFLGTAVTLLAPLTILINILMAAHGPHGLRMEAREVTLATAAFAVGIILVLLVGLAGLLFACFGLGAARRQGQSAALPLAGLLLSLLGLVVFLFAAIDLVFVLVRFNREVSF
jgi:uncharacterized membrane protein